ncbi:MAG: alcohol dehydrogenase [Candidatus Binatia bacterium]|nr:MAG: alcohol dehydrogenase [Candidatus Binatia bacterium]
MRAAFCPEPGKIEVRAVPTPEPAAGEVVVRVRACGICGSDLHFYSGQFPPPPVCPGHEIAGEVARVGAGVTRVREGDAVVVEPLVTCQQCSFCRSGHYQLCRQLRVLGNMVDGGFADFVRVPEYAIFPLPVRLDWAVAALAEPLAVAVHGLRIAPVQAGDCVAVLGAGTIGLLTVAAATASGASEVWVTARHPQQAEAAMKLGATRVFTGTNAYADLAVAADERAPDVVVETVGGHADTLEQALPLVRRGGCVVVLGIFSSMPRLNGILLVIKEVRVVGSMTYGRTIAGADFERALDLLAKNGPVLGQIVTHRFELEDIATAFATAADKGSGSIKVSVVAATG